MEGYLMSKFTSTDKGQEKADWGVVRRAQHLAAIRRNQVSVAEMILFLAEDPPNASAAKEALDELERRWMNWILKAKGEFGHVPPRMVECGRHGREMR
jgi:hypothetical protein